MKLSKIASICKKNKQIQLMDNVSGGENVQWAGDGAALYELAGMPEFTAESLFVALGFDMNDKDCWILSRDDIANSPICVDVDDESDVEATFDLFGALIFKGTEFVIAWSEGEPYLFNKKYFSPLKLDGNFSAVMRTTNGRKYMITKNGMFPTAMIAPAKLSDDLKVWLKTLSEKVR